MEKETILALKSNEKPFGLMTKEMQDFARELKGENWLKYRYGVTSTDWELIEVFPSGDFEESRTYRLRPDYAEPSIVEYIVMNGGSGGERGLVFRKGSDIDNTFISKAIDHPDFVGFKYKDDCDRVSGFARMYQGKEAGASFHAVPFKNLDKYEFLTPTHVIFANAK